MTKRTDRGRFAKLADFSAMLEGKTPDPPTPVEARDRGVIADLEERGIYEDPEAFVPSLNLQAIDDRTYVREPLLFAKWIKDPYYVGEALAEGFYPVVLERFVRIFDPARKPPVREVLMTGSIGWGKTYSTAVAMSYLLYLLSCLRDPPRHLGIKPGTEIVFANLSITGAQAENTLYGNVRGVIKASPYFKERFAWKKSVESELLFPHGIVYRPGNSQETGAIGANVVCAALDEANWLSAASKRAHEKLAGEVDHAKTLYNALSKRIKTRYMHSSGFRGMLFILSSRTHEDSFLDELIEGRRDDEAVEIFEYAHWDVRNPALRSGETFKVAVGGAGMRSKIMAAGEPTAPGTRVITVPQEYYLEFHHDVEGALRDLAGVSTTTVSPFMDPAAIVRQQTSDLAPFLGLKTPLPLAHPFASAHGTEWTYSTKVQDDFVKEIICEPYVRMEGTRKVSSWRPRRAPDESRYVGIDFALTRDACGFAMAYVAGTREVERFDPQTQQVVAEHLPLIVFELLLSIAAPIGDEIMARDVRGLVFGLRDLNFYVGKVTTDQYQSADMRQIFTQEGFDVDEISVDANLDCMESLRSGLSEGWVVLYPHATAERELLKVKRVVTPTKRLKIDHPVRDLKNKRNGVGSKDVVDAMAQVVWTILQEHTAVGQLVKPVVGGYADDKPAETADGMGPRPERDVPDGEEEDDMDSWADPRRAKRPKRPRA